MDYLVQVIFTSINLVAINAFYRSQIDDLHEHEKHHGTDSQHKNLGSLYFTLIPVSLLIAGLIVLIWYCYCKTTSKEEHHPHCPRRLGRSRFYLTNESAIPISADVCPVCNALIVDSHGYGTVNPPQNNQSALPDYADLTTSNSDKQPLVKKDSAGSE